MLQKGSIEAFFLEGYDAAAPDLSAALESFSSRALQTDLRPAYGSRTPRPGVAVLLLAAVVRRRVQEAESLSAVDGSQRRC